MRLVVPYLLVLLFVSTLVLSSGSRLYAAFAALQLFCWLIAIAGLRYKIPVLHRIAAPASAFLVLKAAACCWALQVSLFAGPPLEDMDFE